MTTAPVLPVLATSQPGTPSRIDTPTLLKRGRIGILFATAVLLGTTIEATQIHRGAMKTVGNDSAPSIIAAQHIKAAFADMDGDASDELLSAPQIKAGFEQAFEARLTEASDALVTAAQNITYKDSERKPILAMELGLGAYQRDVQHALDLRATDPNGAIAAYDEAAQEMDTVLLPQAGNLDEANNVVLERTYIGESERSFWWRAVVVVATIATLFCLIGMQLYLSRRTRRTFNPLLLAATLVTFLWSAYSLSEMATEQHELYVAKVEAFESIHDLWRARAVSYEANADQSRALLDERLSSVRADRDRDEMNFESGLIASIPAGMHSEDAVATLNQGGKVPGFTGYLNDELSNITFDGEREQALNSIAFWERYEVHEKEVQDLDKEGRHQEAVDKFLAKQGPVQAAYENFDRVLQATLDINQGQFNSAVQRGFDALQPVELVSTVAAILVAILCFLGVGQRIREYE